MLRRCTSVQIGSQVQTFISEPNFFDALLYRRLSLLCNAPLDAITASRMPPPPPGRLQRPRPLWETPIWNNSRGTFYASSRRKHVGVFPINTAGINIIHVRWTHGMRVRHARP